MITAMIFAGGTGTRMHSTTKPKQFLELNGKPIIIHTLEYFEQHNQVDNIIVVCLEGWIDYLKKLLSRFHITKVKNIVLGGKTGQESIFQGLLAAEKLNNDVLNHIVLIHDGVRPLISDQLITDNIECVKKNGNAITVTKCTETVVMINENDEIHNTIDRNICRLAKAPQSFILGDILSAHHKAKEAGENNIIDSATLMALYGYKLYTVESGSENIKITTPSDFYIFRAIYEARENSQIWGI
ncbi:IspD/TarI family cytidylyltransferase [Robinsoniella peoriensis]|uniref:IspD/TarI family cytidylyltransferase n=1 Tax=Robinsoniella peoriensis TaxID=180332 RepID=UPI00085C166A|nr:IspD/TarI family cytidylyltransferase [Robinsoniella peoriensis]